MIIGSDALNKFVKFIHAQNINQEDLFVLTDRNTKDNCLPQLLALMQIENTHIIEIMPGEASKSIEVCRVIWEYLINHNADRNTVLINLGGGVISDLGGFIASTFKRGIRYINLPTTLIGQVDAAIGSKTGVNFGPIKNQLGTFSDPVGIFIYPEFLKTLKQDNKVSGYAEMLKHGLIADRKYWEELIKLDTPEHIEKQQHLIKKSVNIKSRIVKQDPYEHNHRQILNFGHTIGHALESYSLEYLDQEIPHGNAVAAGMICASYISVNKELLSPVDFKMIKEGIENHFQPAPVNPTNIPVICSYIRHDKKRRGEVVQFTLLKAIGEAITDQPVTDEQIAEAINYYVS